MNLKYLVMLGVDLWRVALGLKHLRFITNLYKIIFHIQKKVTIRGIHFQNSKYVQAKLVHYIRGGVLGVAVDLCKDSPNYKKWVAVELSADNKKPLFIPRGFGHGFVTLKDYVEFVYKTDTYYSVRSIRFDDKAIGI